MKLELSQHGFSLQAPIESETKVTNGAAVSSSSSSSGSSEGVASSSALSSSSSLYSLRAEWPFVVDDSQPQVKFLRSSRRLRLVVPIRAHKQAFLDKWRQAVESVHAAAAAAATASASSGGGALAATRGASAPSSASAAESEDEDPVEEWFARVPLRNSMLFELIT